MILPRPIVQDLTEIQPVTIEHQGTERRQNGGPGGGSISGASVMVMDDPPPQDKGSMVRLAAKVTIDEELLDLLLGLVLADLDGDMAEQRGVELQRRRRGAWIKTTRVSRSMERKGRRNTVHEVRVTTKTSRRTDAKSGRTVRFMGRRSSWSLNLGMEGRRQQKF